MKTNQRQEPANSRPQSSRPQFLW